MNRQDAISLILSIVDGAQSPMAPVIDSEPSQSVPKKSSARKRGADSSSYPSSVVDHAHPPAASSDIAAAVSSSVAADLSARKTAPSQKGGKAEKATTAGASEAHRAPARDVAGEDPAAEERRREDELRRAALNAELAHLPMTDLGNCERFRKRFGHMFKWNASLGWLYWDGRRWAMKGADERVRIAAHETVRAIQDEAKALFDEADAIVADFDEETIDALEEASKKKKSGDVPKKKGRKKKDDDVHTVDAKTLMAIAKVKRLRLLGMELSGWGLDSEMNSKITPIDKHTAPYLAVDVDDLDADPWMINVSNGTIVVDRDAPGFIRFKPHDPADLITKISPVKYDPRAEAPEFDKFIARVQPDDEQRRLLFQWMGYSLTGDTSEQKLMMMHGEGRNGKGVFTRICQYIAGDYAKATPIETFLAETGPKNPAAPTPHLAALVAVRMLTTNEPKKGAVLDEAFIKLVTGEDSLPARPLNKPQFEFLPDFKLTISGNHRPKINDQTESIWARMILVPWEIIIPKEERDLKLDEKLRAEAAGVLNVLLDGLRDWLAHGLVISEKAQRATEKYREDSDPLGRFLSYCTVKEVGAREPSSRLYEMFIAFARATGGPEWKQKGFTEAMKERGYDTIKSNVMYFEGLRAIKRTSDFVDHLGKPLVGEGRDPPAGDAHLRVNDDDEIKF